MGNYNLKINTLRCENCYIIRKATIAPSVPHSFIKFECKCSTFRMNLQNFFLIEILVHLIYLNVL